MRDSFALLDSLAVGGNADSGVSVTLGDRLYVLPH